MNVLEINSMSRSFGNFALRNIDLEVRKGEVVALIGESGSGKSTLLRTIAGFLLPDSGTIMLNGQVVNDDSNYVAPEDRKIGMVFQNYALFPHFTVEKNVAYGVQHLPKTERDNLVNKLLDLVGLKGKEKRYPHRLSGGEQQRVAIARALAISPSLLLLDEPFSNLDAIMRGQVREEVSNIIRSTDTTTILVTHDINDALTVADRIVVLKDGEVEQVGTPLDLYNCPVNRYMAQLFGKCSFLKGTGHDGNVETILGSIPHPEAKEGEHYEISIRPEEIRLGDDSSMAYSGQLLRQQFLGRRIELTVRISNGHNSAIMVIYAPSTAYFQMGQEVHFDINLNKVNLMRIEH